MLSLHKLQVGISNSCITIFEEAIVLLADISSGLIIPLNLKYSLPSFSTSFFCPFISRLPLGNTLTIVTVILPVRVFVWAAVPAPANDWFAPAVKSALLRVPFPTPNWLSSLLATDPAAAPLENSGGKVTPNVSALEVVLVVDLLALKDSFKETVSISPILLLFYHLQKAWWNTIIYWAIYSIILFLKNNLFVNRFKFNRFFILNVWRTWRNIKTKIKMVFFILIL